MSVEAWHIVIIDDNLADRAEIRQLLIQENERPYHFAEAETGAAGLRIVGRECRLPDCILLAHRLPDMDAVEFLARLSGLDGYTQCPVVVLTGKISRERALALRQAGAQDYLSKQWLNPDSLARVVENAVERWTTAGQLREKEHRLRVSEDRYRKLMDHATDAIFLHDNQGTVLDANQMASEALGYSRDELIGMSPQQYDPSATPGLLASLGATLDTGALVAFDTVHRRKDGSTFPVEVRIRPFHFEGIQHGLSIARDITDRKKAENAIRDRERLLGIVTANARVGLVVVNESYEYLFANQAYAEILGLPTNQIIGRRVPELLPDGWPQIQSRLDRALSGERVVFELTLPPLQGEFAPRWFRVMYEPQLTDLGKPTVVVVVVDITERKRESTFLARQNGILERIATGAPLGEVLDETVRMMEDQIPGLFGSILLLKRDRYLHLGAAPNLPPEYNAAIEGLEIGPAVGSCGTAAYSRKPVFVADIAADPLWTDFRSFALAHGLKACWSTPIFAATRGSGPPAVLGTFALYAQTPGTPSPQFIELISQAEHVASIAIESQRMLIDLRDSEHRLRLFIEHAPAALAMLDREMRYLAVSQRWSSDYGLGEQNLCGQSHYDIFPEISAEWREVHRRALAGEVLRSEQDSFKHADGTLHWIRWEIRPWHDGKGAVAGIAIFTEDITDRYRAESALRQSEARFRRVFEHAATGIAISDTKGRFQQCNPAYCELLGYTEAELRQMDFSSLVHPEDREANSLQIPCLLDEGFPAFEIENRYIHKSGEEVWVRKYVSVLPDETGNKVSLMALVTDVTERHRAERALRESEARFRTLIDILPDAIFINAGDRVIFCNPACLRLLGATSLDQILGKSPFELHPPAYHAMIRERIATMRESNRPVPGAEEQILRLDGQSVPVFASALPFDDQGTNSVLVVLHDLTDQKRIEAQLRLQEMMLREAAEMAHVGGWGFDPVTLEGDWTAETARIHDLESCTESNVSLGLSFFTGNDRERIETAVQEAISHGTPYDLELQLATGAGARKWVRTICRPIVEHGKVVRVRGSLQDITERKQAETAIRQLNTELEQRVRERTAELEASNRELEAFSYSVSHDLRAPLRAIDGFSRIVLDEFGPLLPEEGRVYLSDVRTSTRRMGALIDDLLAFSRLGRQPIRREKVKPREMVESALSEVLRPLVGRQIQSSIDDLPDCEADPGLLRQVWLNLLANAIKYTARKPVTIIEVGTVVGPDDTSYFVRDNGVGFDMRYADKLFGVFQRLHKAEDYEGTGIGLALVQRIIHRHGGRIWAEAEPEKGATFFFTLGKGGKPATDVR